MKETSYGQTDTSLEKSNCDHFLVNFTTDKEFVQNENVMKTTISSKKPGKQSFSEVSLYLVSKIFLTVSSDIKLTLQKRLEKIHFKKYEFWSFFLRR